MSIQKKERRVQVQWQCKTFYPRKNKIFAYLLIKYMKDKNIKNADINIRIRKQEKEKLQTLAKKQGVTLSNYILTKCLTDTNELLQLIPDAVDTWNTYNEIFHAVESTNDTQLTETIRHIINRHLPKTSQTDRKDNENEEI